MTLTESDLVSGEELARWLGLSGKEIYDLAKAGILVRVGRAYRLEQSVRRYCEHLRRKAATDNATSRTAD
jgi:biotin operon repressor